MKQESNILISIIIPTYNGGRYIKTCLESVISSKVENIEIIVSDDGSDDDTLNIINNFTDPRIITFSNNTRLGMQKNYEKAVERSQGDWIVLIGQDDLMMPSSLEIINEIIQADSNLEIIVSSRGYFNWADSNNMKITPKVIIYKNNLIKRKIKSKKRLMLTLLGLVSYNQGPQMYTGSIIKKSLVEKIKEKQESIFFLYPIPDVSSAISILDQSVNYLRIYHSLFLVGTSKSSTGAKIEKLLDVGKKEILNQFDTTADYDFVPGRGLTTNLQWYMVEAADMILSKKLKHLGQKFFKNNNFRLASILAMDLRNITDNKFKKLYFETNKKLRILDSMTILQLVFIIKIIYTLKLIFKYIYIIILLITKRIVIRFRVQEKDIIHLMTTWD